MRLLLDENLSPRHAARLNAMGHAALAVTEANLSGASDTAIRAFAVREGRILVTLDADFGNIIRFSPVDTPGVVWLRPSPPTEAAIASLLERMVNALAEFNMSGKLAVVEQDKIRIRAG